jgi:glycosyltransferase involved in cell wall biosynthesis
VLEAWHRCSVALVPSVWAEPFGLVVLEAMAAARPVIASAAGGLADIVLHGETGLLVPPGDAGALRAALAQLLAAPGLQARLGEAGRRRAEEYRASRIAPRVEAAYALALARRSAPRPKATTAGGDG